MKKIVYIFVSLFVLQSCRTQKDVLYFQNLEEVDINKANLSNINEYKFQPGDDLMINISVDNEELLKPFKIAISSDQRTANAGTNALTSYTINERGIINLPQIGEIKVSGLTRQETIDLLTKKTSLYLKDPIINVKLNNFRVTILGEGIGSVVDIRDENTNILEVIAKSNTVKRGSDIDNIILIRKEADQRIRYTVNLKDANIFNEPYFFVKQNDIIYIKPSKISTFTFNNAPLTILSSILSLGVTIYALFIKK